MEFFSVVKRSPIVFPLACVAAVAMVFISEGSYRQAVATLDTLGKMATARTSIEGLERNILDAETAQRGYLLTDRNESLMPYDKALKNLDESFKLLKLYYRENQQQTEVLSKLHALTQTKLADLALAIRLHEKGENEAANEVVLSDIGKPKLETIRSLSAQLLEHETLKVAERRDDIYQTLQLSRVGISALSAISLLALLLYLRQASALIEYQQELKRVVRAERDGLEIEVAQRTAQLTELTQHLQSAREDERNRLARDLHDELGALLTSAKLDAARIKSRLAGTAPEAQERLTHLVGTLNSGIALKRRIIEDLRPSALSNLGLVATLEILAREFTERSGVEVNCTLASVRLEADAELMVYRLVQEAITNITKYASAAHVWINLGAHDGQVEASVRDDGVGFDTTSKTGSHYGLLGMRFRVEAEGGTLTLVSAPGKGTLIQVTLPESTITT